MGPIMSTDAVSVAMSRRPVSSSVEGSMSKIVPPQLSGYQQRGFGLADCQTIKLRGTRSWGQSPAFLVSTGLLFG